MRRLQSSVQLFFLRIIFDKGRERKNKDHNSILENRFMPYEAERKKNEKDFIGRACAGGCADLVCCF